MTQLANFKYSALCRVLNYFYLNPKVVEKMKPEECKDILQAVADQYVNLESGEEVFVDLLPSENIAYAIEAYREGSVIIFSDTAECMRIVDILDQALVQEEKETEEKKVQLDFHYEQVRAVKDKIILACTTKSKAK